ncbi:LCP family protein required for cell wall assembly [Mycolicibacterium sp. BK556]|uniref:LCP family protein n=1 Tax=unclassified Mycolicibacterium TaxID=2636767 RepID=UPI00161C7544|nr:MULTISPECIES: LCP family protein [unclassified Mycolicibacterium]MBB3601835.1 LCP family protein required for cell wall assembly [Mycolicibacterium sp. BK556]MBB3631587.1 LCP family protein required for cell wall assembly [Mycolicibacterium sp. BK607]MBB3749591.1 LCP family protein required for cell wall assembly [Mycolicibacterium sp. BK634]
MSDGGNASPGQHRAPDEGERVTPAPRSGAAAAPWERARAASHRAAEAGPSSGSHTEGVTVADLIAKLSGSTAPAEPSRHRSEAPPDDEPAELEELDEATDLTVPIPVVVAAYADEVPDLEALNRARGPLVADPDPATTAAPKSSKKKKTKALRPVLLAGRSAAAVFAVSALVLTGGAWQWQSTKNDLLRNVAALDPNSRDIVDPNAQFGDENFLIVGVDTRTGANGEIGAGTTEDAGGARSDTVMLVNIPADRKRVVVVSFPRDLAITPAYCQAWDPDTGNYGPVVDKNTGEKSDDYRYTETKLNSAYSYGGPKCLVKVIQKMSGLSINRFMAVDFAGFSKMVDALGGVDVCSTTPLDDYELGTVLASAGHQTLDGHTALNYVRARQVTTEVNGDYGRIKRQQLFLSSLLRSIISKDTLFSLSKLNNVVNMFIDDTYVDNVRTKDLVDLGQSLQGVNAGRITFVTVPTTGITDADGNEQPRTQDIRSLFDAIINDDPLPGENDTNATTSPLTAAQKTLQAAKPNPTEAQADTTQTELVNAVTTDPSDISVQVSNSTGQDGLGATAAAALREHGFRVLEPEDYTGSAVTTTTVMFSAGNEQAAATVAAAFPAAQMERVDGLKNTVQVVLGPDFSAVGAPPPSGSTVSVHVSRNTNSTPTQLPEDLTVTNAADVTCE